MRRDMYNIDLEIPNSGIFIKGLDNEKLTISLDLIKFMEVNRSKIVFSGNKLDIGKLTKPLNPYIIYNILEENNKNNFNGVKIIDKIEDNNNIVYHFNFGLILNTFIGKSKPPRWINQNTSDNLKELNEIKAFIAPCFFSYEIIGDVTSIPPSELEDLKNDYGYEGKDYKSIFKNEVYINFSCYERMYFSNCEFKSKVSLHIIDNDNTVSFLNGIDFSNCIFEDEINFKRFISGTSLPENKYYNNEQDTLFKNCIFKKRVDFHNSNFFNSIYFNNSHFKDYVDFHECEFKKTACFYGVRFDKTPNFSQAIFKENLNVVNTNLNFAFGDLQERIKQEYKDFNETKEKKPLDKFANDFRDSFRTFKNALIKDNNLLDASNFHKCELYCKEIELKESWNKKGENVKDMTDLEKNISRIRDFVDFLLLGFYRKLCDHHTDFLKVFNNLVLLIVLYALFFRGFIWLHDDELKDTRKILTLFEFFDSFKFGFNIGVGICIVLGFILVLCKIDKISIKSFSNILKNFKYLSYIKKWLPKIFKKEIFVKPFLKLKIILLDLGFLIESLIIIPLIPCVFYVLLSPFGFFLNLDKDFGYSLFINILFISLYICLVYTKSLFFGRYVVLVLSYIGFFIILIKQPSIIHPLIGKIANEADKSFNYPSLMVLNILYTILLALVLFSLQKTARKNSIVPS